MHIWMSAAPRAQAVPRAVPRAVPCRECRGASGLARQRACLGLAGRFDARSSRPSPFALPLPRSPLPLFRNRWRGSGAAARLSIPRRRGGGDRAQPSRRHTHTRAHTQTHTYTQRRVAVGIFCDVVVSHSRYPVEWIQQTRLRGEVNRRGDVSVCVRLSARAPCEGSAESESKTK